MNSGSYRIWFSLEKDISVEIGSLGKIDFRRGVYVYTGSAMRNLRQRVARHLLPSKKVKWHIDYLLVSSYCRIEKAELFYSTEKEECIKNIEIVNMPMAEIPVLGFGSSDCKNCRSHLVFFPNLSEKSNG